MSAQSGNNMYVARVISTYWIVSISMVYLNKMLLSNEEASVSAPLFVTWYQCLLSCVICVVLGNFGERSRARGNSSLLNDFPKVKHNLTSGRRLFLWSNFFDKHGYTKLSRNLVIITFQEEYGCHKSGNNWTLLKFAFKKDIDASCFKLGNPFFYNRQILTFITIDFHTSIGMSVLPLSLIFVGMISFNNLCLQLVEVSFCKYINVLLLV